MSMNEEEKVLEITNSIEHTYSDECRCAECQCDKERYVQIIGVDRYIDNLNDWD